MDKVVLSPGQAILLFIPDAKGPDKTLLEKIYLSGPTSNPEEHYLKNKLQSLSGKYEVKFDIDTINNDNVRRYFETKLSLKTMHSNIGTVYQTLNNYILKIAKLNKSLSEALEKLEFKFYS